MKNQDKILNYYANSNAIAIIQYIGKRKSLPTTLNGKETNIVMLIHYHERLPVTIRKHDDGRITIKNIVYLFTIDYENEEKFFKEWKILKDNIKY